MQDLIARVIRELPDTDKSRYDIAYERGRAQARSAHFFGGLALGAIAGAATVFFFDPANGRVRRENLARQLTARSNDLRRAIEERWKDVRNRFQGRAMEAGPMEPPEEHPTDAERVAEGLRQTSQARVLPRSAARATRSEEPVTAPR